MDREATLRRMYEHFNDREVQLAADYMRADVDWPNVLEGTRLNHLADVIEYWQRQFAEFDPRVYPVEFAELPDGRLRVLVNQEIHDLEGNVTSQSQVFHDYTFRDGLVARMDVAPAG
jgi:hypothetical protein